jgi:hypothetical protein
LLLGRPSRAKPLPWLEGDFCRQRYLLFGRGRALKLPTADTRQRYAWGFPQLRQKTFCTATPALHKPVPQLKQIFIKNITPKFHFGRQLSSLVAVSETSITTRNVEG